MPIEHADLRAMVDQITATVRHEVGLARDESAKDIRGVYRRIDELKTAQSEDRARVNAQGEALAEIRREQQHQGELLRDCQDDCSTAATEIAALHERTRNVQPMLGISLSKKQKAALGSALAAIGVGAVDLARHAITFILAYLSQPKHS